MGHNHANIVDPNKENYTFGGRMKTLSIVFILLGILGVIIALFDKESVQNHNSRLWSNLLLNTYYFNGMAITAVFFIAASTLAYGGWFVLLKRVFESFGYFVFVTFVLFGIIILGIWFDWHNLYDHWLKPHAGDTIVYDKIAFLNKNMFTAISLVFFIGWMFLIVRNRRYSLKDDSATNLYEYNQVNKKWYAAPYIVLFGVSTSIFSWLAVMSLDPHWYSTLFGWYNFASYMCGFLCFAIIIVLYLKYKGHLNNVNDSHLHDLGKFLFGFSVFYTYLWFSQFMLIWYGNIPEDTMYFVKRFNVPLFKVLFFVTFIINFVFPFLFILKRSAKRNPWIIGTAAVILLVGHYFDFYLMVMPEPNTVEVHEASHNEDHKLHAANATNTTVISSSKESNVADSVKTVVEAVSIEEHKTEAVNHSSDQREVRGVARKNR